MLVPKRRTKGVTLMSNTDEAKGRLKKAAGELTGDEELKREGELDKLSGKVKDVVDDVKDKLTGKD